jgi:hypothetical protein
MAGNVGKARHYSLYEQIFNPYLQRLVFCFRHTDCARHLLRADSAFDQRNAPAAALIKRHSDLIVMEGAKRVIYRANTTPRRPLWIAKNLLKR